MAESREQYAEQLLAAVNDAARTVSTRFVTFLTVGVYVAVTIASTTDEMLVKGSLVTLPLLNTQIPISGWFGFYTVAPWLIVALHVDLLLQLSMLGTRLAEFEDEVALLTEEQQRHYAARLPGFYYVQFLAAAHVSRLRRVLSGVIIYSSMILFPLLLLCWTQARFLAVHDANFTLVHKLAVIADVVVILVFLWRPLATRSASRTDDASSRHWRRRIGAVRAAMVLVCGAVLVFCLSAGVPQTADDQTFWFGSRNLDLRQRVLNGVSEEAINALGGDDVEQREQELRKVSRLSFLQGRDLRYANLFNAVLPRLDLRSLRASGDSGELRETQLQGADLQWTQMQEVLLNDANLQQAKLCGAQVQGGALTRTRLEGADLTEAKLQAAQLMEAHLDRAVLARARLQGADLSGALLRRANLTGAQMQGAFLRGAQLQGADLSGAALQGADLSNAQLAGANLRGAQLQGAVLCGAFVEGADFDKATLELVAVDRAAIGDCPDRRAAGVEACGVAEGDDAYVRLAAFLTELACSDAYVARALSAQACAADPSRLALADALLAEAEKEPPCRGLKLLPEGAVTALGERAKANAPADARRTAQAS